MNTGRKRRGELETRLYHSRRVYYIAVMINSNCIEQLARGQNEDCVHAGGGDDNDKDANV